MDFQRVIFIYKNHYICEHLKKNQNMYKLLLSLFIFFIMSSLHAQSVPEITGSLVTREEAQQALDFHNKARADVGSPPLTWSVKLSEYAQAWANHLANDGCNMEHRPRSGEWTQEYGENIYWGSGFVATALTASESWYAEIKDYKHAVRGNDNWHGTGHYTQMVWKTSTSVGFGVVKCADGAMIVVANYDPAGNYMGEWAY